MSYQQMAAGLIAGITFIALATGSVPLLRLNRATIAVVGAGALLALGVLALAQAASTIDPNTILLLFSMMVINAVLELAGFFNWAGQLVIERASSPLVLLVLIVMTSGALSAMFLNDPVVLMLTPLVCGITLRLRRDPIPYLVALATSANVGSTATITGNPQNILIGTSSGIPYLTFLVHLGPVAIVGMGIVVAVIYLLYPAEFRHKPFEPPAETEPPDGPPRMSMASAAAMVYAPVLRKSLVVIVALMVAFFAGAQVPLAAFFAACALLITRRIKSQKILYFPNPTQAWFTLAAASTLAGNLTLIGSVANLIVAEQALKLGVRLTFMEYLRAGVIITVLTLVVAVVWLELVT